MNKPFLNPNLSLLLLELAVHDRDDDWDTLIRSHGLFIRNECRIAVDGDTTLIEDAFQETLLQVQMALPSYYCIDEPTAIAWLRIQARRSAFNLARSIPRHRQPGSRMEDSATMGGTAMQRALNELSEPDRRMLEARFIERISRRAIAEEFAIKPIHIDLAVFGSLRRLHVHMFQSNPGPSRSLVGLLRSRSAATEAKVAL